MRAITLVLCSLFLALAASAASAEEAKYDPKAAFAETDTNKDGVVDHGELYVRIVDVYYLADTNKDGTLSPDELRQLPLGGDSKEGDQDGSGGISLREFLRLREHDFQAADTNDDEVLTVEEVIIIYQGRKP